MRRGRGGQGRAERGREEVLEEEREDMNDFIERGRGGRGRGRGGRGGRGRGRGRRFRGQGRKVFINNHYYY